MEGEPLTLSEERKMDLVYVVEGRLRLRLAPFVRVSKLMAGSRLRARGGEAGPLLPEGGAVHQPDEVREDEGAVAAN